jgi:LuxR family transcriptional regulator, activator of conjugal transfer of Ti plasmids
MDRVFKTFLEQLNMVHDKAGFTELLHQTIHPMGFNRFAYIGLPLTITDAIPGFTSYAPSWQERYLAQKYQRSDYVTQRASHSSDAFIWGQGHAERDLSPTAHKIFDEASHYGIWRGFSVPIHHRSGNLAIVSFSTENSGREFLHSVETNRFTLHLIALYFHSRINNVLVASAQEELSKLTVRELECLTWSARGKSARDIGDILNLSHWTVKYYLDNARQKLGVGSIKQAIAMLAVSTQAPIPDFWTQRGL